MKKRIILKKSLVVIMSVSLILPVFTDGNAGLIAGNSRADAAKKIKLKVAKKKVTVKAGKKYKVKYSASGKIKAVSGNKKIAKVSVGKKNIVVKGIKKGKTNIKVTCMAKKTARIKVTVRKADIKKEQPVSTVTPKPTVDPSVIYEAAKGMEPYAGSVNKFGNKILRGLHEDNSNTFISPFSIYVALAMLANGASGSTYTEIANTLGITDIANLNSVIGTYISGSMDEEVTFNVADSLWLGKNLIPAANINENFINPLSKYYNSDVKQNINFSDNKTVELANKWVEEKTNGMIKNIFSGFDPATVALLINALYFEGRWSDTFRPENTADELFHGLAGDKNVKMMTNYDMKNCVYFDNGQFKGIELDYGKKHRYSMELLLSSDDNVSTTALWNSLTDEERYNTLEGINTPGYKLVTARILKLPRFSIDYSTNGKLKEVLGNMGIKEVFGSSADLSGIGKNVFVSDVKHKTVLEVNEEGSKAAAVTYVMVAATAMKPVKPEEVDFIVNRPFILAIRDRVSGMILFMGEVNNL